MAAAPSGLRSQVDGLSALAREHDLQLDQNRRAIAALDEEKVRMRIAKGSGAEIELQVTEANCSGTHRSA